MDNFNRLLDKNQTTCSQYNTFDNVVIEAI